MVSLSEVVTDTEGFTMLITSFLWILSLTLKGVSDFPTYCFPHLRQSIKWMTLLLLQLSLYLMLKPLFVVLFENVLVCLSCYNHFSRCMAYTLRGSVSI